MKHFACLVILFVLLAEPWQFAEAGEGVKSGTLQFTMVLDYLGSCSQDNECLELCKGEATNPNAIQRARCIKFVGNFNNYCCCYASNTNACCQNANSGLDCVPS